MASQHNSVIPPLSESCFSSRQLITSSDPPHQKWMGFYWSVEMQVAFVQPVTIPGEVSWSRTLGALQKFDGGGSLFAAAAQALPAGSGVPETVAKRARTARSVMVTAADVSDDEDPYEGNFEVLYNAGPDAFMLVRLRLRRFSALSRGSASSSCTRLNRAVGAPTTPNSS